MLLVRIESKEYTVDIIIRKQTVNLNLLLIFSRVLLRANRLGLIK